MHTFDPLQWSLLFVAAFLVGLAKTGIPGIGMLFIAIFANVLPAREAVGVVLPLLICGDIVAVIAYRRHAQWRHLLRLFLWTAAGVVAGYLVMGKVGNKEVSLMTGSILILMIAIHFWRQAMAKRAGGEAPIPTHFSFALFMGLFAGFTTMVSNAAGPIMVIYLLAMRLPKMEFMGTGAWYFFVINCFKIPFAIDLGIINGNSLMLDAKLAPLVLAGALAGRLLIGYIPQKLFERIAIALTFAAAMRLLLW